MKNIGIIRESRSDERRTPLIPKHIKQLYYKFSNIKITVQPSKERCFSDKEYHDNGAVISENLDNCDLILGVKEIEPNLLIPFKTYIFFSHTTKINPYNFEVAQGTPGMDKKELLKVILDKKITLIDYENIRDNFSRRYLGFGRFAGIVGCYNALNLYLKTYGEKTMPRAYELNSYEKLIEKISKTKFAETRIIVTGDGRVAKGALELLKYSNIKEINSEEYLKNNNSFGIYCNLPTSKYVLNNENKIFDLQHFINFPEKYTSVLNQFMNNTNILISAHYWDPKSPKLLEKKDIKKFNKLKVIGDITCDINGSIPPTIKSSTIKNPYYYINRESNEETSENNNALSIMAVDNLPSELPRESSEEFGDGIFNEVLPFILNKDDGRIMRAKVTENGLFCSNYKFLLDYLKNN